MFIDTDMFKQERSHIRIGSSKKLSPISMLKEGCGLCFSSLGSEVKCRPWIIQSSFHIHLDHFLDYLYADVREFPLTDGAWRQYNIKSRSYKFTSWCQTQVLTSSGVRATYLLFCVSVYYLRNGDSDSVH